MKKVLTILLTLLLCGCDKNANVINPVVSYDSLEEINEKVGTNLVDLKEYGIVSDERFSVINDKISEYCFVIDGYDICFRSSKGLNEDISGLYIDGQPAFDDFSSAMDFNFDSNNKAHRFVIGDDCQYTITTTYMDDPDDELFLKYISLISDKLIVKLSKPENVELEGDYEEINSKEVEAYVQLYEVDGPWLEIVYPTSSGDDEWLFELKEDGNGKYSYENSSHYSFTYDETGEISNYESIDDCLPGYIEYKDGAIYMTGTNIEQLMNCVFKKVQ